MAIWEFINNADKSVIVKKNDRDTGYKKNWNWNPRTLPVGQSQRFDKQVHLFSESDKKFIDVLDIELDTITVDDGTGPINVWADVITLKRSLEDLFFLANNGSGAIESNGLNGLYKASTLVIAPPPTLGHVVWGNANQIGATVLYFSSTTSDSKLFGNVLAAAKINDEIFLFTKNAPDDFQRWKITGITINTGNVQYDVSLIESNKVFASEEDLFFELIVKTNVSDIPDNSIGFNKIVQIASKLLLGRWSIGTGDIQTIQLDPGTLVLDNSGVLKVVSAPNGWDGQVSTRNDLPVTLPTPEIGEIYLVEQPISETLFGVTYKTWQSGLYIRDTLNGNLNDWRRLNIKTQFLDSEFKIANSAVTSKQARFDASSITAGNTRVLSIQDKNYTIAGLDDVKAVYDQLIEIESSGVCEGMLLTIDIGNLTYSISSGIYQIVDGATLTKITFASQSGISLPSLAIDTIYYVFIDVNGTLNYKTSKPLPEDYYTEVLIGGLVVNNNEIAFFSNLQVPTRNIGWRLKNLTNAIGLINAEGNLLSPASNNLTIAKTSGYLYTYRDGATNNDSWTSIPALDTNNGDTFILVKRDNIVNPTATSLDVTNYDNNGTITPIGGGSNSSANWFVFVFPLYTVVVYPQTFYATLEETELNIQKDASNLILPDLFSTTGFALGVFTVDKIATDLSNTIEATYRNGSKFGEFVGGGSNPDTSVQNVTTSLPLESTGGTDPNISIADGVALNDILIWNGSSWIISNLKTNQFAITLSSVNWILDTGTTYYQDVVHNLNTEDVTVTTYNPTTKETNIVEVIDRIDVNTVRIKVEGNTDNVRVVVMSDGVGVTIPNESDKIPVNNPSTPYNPNNREVILWDCSSGNKVINLSQALLSSGHEVNIKKVDSTGNTITVNGIGDLIDGQSSILLSSQWDNVTVFCDGNDWFIL